MTADRGPSSSPRNTGARHQAATAGERYSAPAMLLHWVTAVLVLGLLAVGLWMVGLEISRQKLVVYGWHKWIGLAVLAILVVRLAWRAIRRPPPLPVSIAPWERRAAAIAHALLYALLLAMPLSGWAMSSAAGQPVIWFGLWQLPDPVGRDPALLELCRSLHHWLSRLLMLTVALHIAAVVRHDLLRRDGVLRRMLPAWRGE